MLIPKIKLILFKITKIHAKKCENVWQNVWQNVCILCGSPKQADRDVDSIQHRWYVLICIPNRNESGNHARPAGTGTVPVRFWRAPVVHRRSRDDGVGRLQNSTNLSGTLPGSCYCFPMWSHLGFLSINCRCHLLQLCSSTVEIQLNKCQEQTYWRLADDQMEQIILYKRNRSPISPILVKALVKLQVGITFVALLLQLPHFLESQPAEIICYCNPLCWESVSENPVNRIQAPIYSHHAQPRPNTPFYHCGITAAVRREMCPLKPGASVRLRGTF